MILDLFAGPGGWDEGLRLLGITDVVGIEWDKWAHKTRLAAGHESSLCDVRQFPSQPWEGITGLIASPPCQTFSDAGKQQGRRSLSTLINAAGLVLDGAEPAKAATMTGLADGDPRTTLILEPLRFIRDCQPPWVAMEEVGAVLPVFKALAHLLTEHGYSCWAGKLNSADYGVPQIRRRAFLLASRSGPPRLPDPTHCMHGSSDLFGLEPWITMAEALDLGPEPDDLTSWAWHRPATTVVRSFCPQVIAAPGYRQKGDPSRQNAPGSITVTPEQMCVLQGIRTDYPFQGSPSKIPNLIGAILPPPWAAAILSPLIGVPL